MIGVRDTTLCILPLTGRNRDIKLRRVSYPDHKTRTHNIFLIIDFKQSAKTIDEIFKDVGRPIILSGSQTNLEAQVHCRQVRESSD